MAKIKLFFWVIIMLITAACTTNSGNWEVLSPSGNIKIKVKLSENEGSLSYVVEELSTNETVLAIEESPLGILLSNTDFNKNLSLLSISEIKEINETFKMYSGKHSQVVNKANELVLSFQNTNNKTLELIVRAMDEGVAFRYSLPGNGEMLTVENELSGFNLPETGKAWMQAYDTISMWSPAYEQFLQNSIPIGTTAPSNKNGWCFPMLFESKGIWTLISEADLDPDYCGMHIQPEAPNGLYTLRFPEKEETYNNCAQKPISKLPFQTPWRFILVSRNIGDILESDMVYKLSKPNKIAETNWVKPGKAAWSWWSDSPSPKSFEKQKHYIQAAAELGWEYVLVDANWNEMTGGNLQQLADLANKSGVGLLAWYNSGGPGNIVTEAPRDKMHKRQIRRAEFKKLQEWGVKGVKVDFFQSDKQEIIKQYIDILEDAADFEILVNFHGCTLPRGWTRTYPHLLSSEAVRGAESYKFSKAYPEYAPVQNTIIPFVRNVVGPVDFTPVTFSDVTYPHITSFAHELALSVIFESGIIHFADDVDVYQSQADFVIDFLKSVPAAWDETKYLQGYPGEFVVLARRKGTDWYIAGINGEKNQRNIELDLSFINGEISGLIIADGEDNRMFASSEITTKKLKVRMLPFGGFVCKIQ